MIFRRVIQAIGRTIAPVAGNVQLNGKPIDIVSDKVGRMVSVLNQIRELVDDDTTNIVTGTETVILAAMVDTYHDTVMISGSNDSDQVISVAIRDVAGGGEIIRMTIPAGGVSQVSFYVPLGQTTVNTDWTAEVVSAVSVSDSPINMFIQAVRNI